MKPVRIGIIGVGNIANNAHIPMLLQCEQAEITAICDVNEDNLRATGDRLGLDEAHRFFSYQELIACQDVDAVEICTPNYLHVPMALDVLAAGKKLNIEKPLGIFLLSRLCVRLGWGALPEGATWRGLLAVSCLGGIGFTMSIFINTLAFGDPVYVASGKIAVLAASFSAIGVSLLGMRFLMRGKALETE